MQTQEGFLDFKGYKTWYCVYGDLSGSKTPLIGLHGGPGWPHYSLLPLTELVDSGVPVILYDQLGCGRSDRPDSKDLWTIELFIEELSLLTEILKINSFNLLGHSWGGTLAIEYVLQYPRQVDKLILNSPLLDTQLWIKEADRLKDLLPQGIAEIMRKHEAQGTAKDPEYKKAYDQFVQNFVCRIVPIPLEHVQADEEWGKPVYNTMWGPSEACATGTLKEYSALDRLADITTPTLIISGKYDEATPLQMEMAKSAIPNSEWLLLENSSHSALFEEQDAYLKSLTNFLKS